MLEDKIKILRGLASWILSAVGIWIMSATSFTCLLGPHLLNVSAGLASIFMVGFLAYRWGASIK